MLGRRPLLGRRRTGGDRGEMEQRKPILGLKGHYIIVQPMPSVVESPKFSFRMFETPESRDPVFECLTRRFKINPHGYPNMPGYATDSHGGDVIDFHTCTNAEFVIETYKEVAGRLKEVHDIRFEMICIDVHKRR